MHTSASKPCFWRLMVVIVCIAASRQASSAADKAPLSVGAPNGPTATVRAFQFGTPNSSTRAGFTKVTAKDAFTPEKGYGFQFTQGLLAYDRGGSEIV